MAHVHDPSDVNSPASTFAKDQPRRGVAADDVEQKGQLAEGQETASQATEADAGKDAEREPLSTGPDRAPHEDPLHEVVPGLADDEEEAAKQAGNIPRAAPRSEGDEGRKRASAPVEEGTSGGGSSSSSSSSSSGSSPSPKASGGKSGGASKG